MSIIVKRDARRTATVNVLSSVFVSSSSSFLYFDKLGAISLALPEPLKPAETKNARPPMIPSAINVMKRELDNFYSSVVNAIQERPCGYLTDIPGALGDSIIVPVSIINLPDTFATLNLSKFLGAGPAKYSPTILYFDP